jgi:ABC-2 type transport system permease protein
MNWPIVGAIIRKDVRAFLRDRFFMYMTVAGIVVYIVLFWLLPSSVNETITLGVHQSGLDTEFAALGAGSTGLEIIEYSSADQLRVAVEDGTDGVVAGLDFPDAFRDLVAAGAGPEVELLLTADVPGEYRAMMRGLVGEIAFAIAGEAPPVNPATTAVILGTDRAGDQVSLQEQLRPLLAFFVLMVEMMALASLVAAEVQQRTVTAVLITPARTRDFIAAKGIFGTGLAFLEAALLLLAIGAFSTGAPILVIVLLLGAMLVTGFGMVAGALGRDFVSVLFWSMAFLIPLMIPGMGALFPGSAAAWIKALPSYGLVEAILGVTAYGDGWREAAPYLLGLGAWSLAAFAAGTVILRRRVATI